MPNRTVNLAPYPYAAQQAEIDRRRKMAQALQQQAMEPIEQPTMPGVRISPVQGLAKLLQQFSGQYQQGKLDKEQRALDTARQTEQQKRALEMARTIVPQANPADYAATVGQPGVSSAMSGAAATPPPPPVAAGSSGNESIASPRMVAPMPAPIPQGFQMNSPAAAQQATNQQVNTLAAGMASPDPIQQQMAQAMVGDINAQKREQRAALTAQGKTKEEQDFQMKLADKHADLARELAQMKPPAGDLAEWAEFQKLYPKPGDQTPENFYAFKQGQLRPAVAPTVTPHTVTTDQGVMQWNPASGKFDIKVGNRPPTAGQVTGVTSGNWGTTGTDFLNSIPAQWRKTVEKLAHYDEDPSKVTSMRGGMRETVMQWVNQVNPDYDASLFSNRAPTRKAFTTGTQGQQINAINTAIGHIDQITGLADKLQNGGFVPGNQAFNTVRTMFGADQVTNFDTLKDALSGEVASVLAKGGATVSGIAEAKDKIKASSSPTQLAGYVKTLIPVMGSKLSALDYQYHQAMGPNDPFSALSPDSQTILAKHGFNPQHGAVSGGGGGGPKVGDVEDGHIFLGGNPADPKNWKKQ